jgi:hypothetical protein
MSLRWIALVVLLPLSMLTGGGCALVTTADRTLDEGGSGGGVVGPRPDEAGTTASDGGGGYDDGGYDGGVDAAFTPAPTSYQYLCGGSAPVCLPGAATDSCALGGNPGLGGAPASAPEISCQLVRGDGGGVTAQCGRAGASTEGGPCISATDCGPELGCIATGLTPICRAYCCDGLESCPASTYCVKAPMAEDQASEIPVCIPATPCALLDDATCPLGETCTIVRASGTTSCVIPGTGTYGEACPCAAGYTCSDGTCLQLCHTDGTNAADADECGPNAFCQGGQEPYPNGIGQCIPYG